MEKARSSRAALARGGAFGFIGAASSAVLGFLLTLMLTRLLGNVGAGVILQATGVFSLVLALSKVGMDSTAIFLLPRLKKSAPEEIRPTVHLMSVVAVGASLIVATGLFFAAPLLWGGQSADLVSAIQAIAWFLPAGALLLVAAAALRALGGMREFVLTQQIALPLLRPPAVALAFFATGSLLVVSMAWALPLVMVLTVALYLLWRRLGQYPAGPWLPEVSRGRELAAFAAPRTLAAGLEQAITWLDVLIVGTILGTGAAGIYGGASRFIQAGMLVDSALRVVVSPQLSSMVHEKRFDELRSLYATATTWLVLFASPIYVLMAIYSPTLMDILGEGFAEGAGVVVVLAGGACVTFLAGNIHTLLIMSGFSGWAAINKIIIVIVNVVANLLLLPHLGIIAAALSWALCMVIDAILAFIEVRHFLGLSLGVLSHLWPLLLVALSVALPAFGVSKWLGQGLLSLAVACALSLISFALTVVTCRKSLHLSGLRAR
ncbi:MAG: polysaccharide biosynthesis C-terminal domain-containing protein [Actinomycetaceae bacterium]|nr:polysaccharide biosynthesis C-terminal domain-containing protein [Actinomycetaceae bacterium]